ncbi:hypothetical protein DL95DRAFT_399611 [Leptodontidium sp. 2 PMI_412]|nr:hypothetical protein DL95DRAFT_399611 [Leptodontidium sp. 2 PMI_412]
MLHLTCVLQEHRGEGLGWMIGKYVLNQAEQRQKRVFLQATPEGKPLYLKLGFGLKAEVSVDLKEFGKEGTYVQSTMVWDPYEPQTGDVDVDGV